ncbi:hypothetical protein JX265_005922 [Neoarthrinium moseri]|uniref:Transcription factor IIA, alpha/beta subunit n=1 Tax=Neoarthrinium moseri TaxID=1658444 RepID=A0A9P9WMW5_9PEZI|nr:hypothetical protein JX265_005922 [Neoarthrinium moseri]
MSNTQVGQVYQQIILDVLEASRVDLEENGVDESILEELKQGWQKKLSAQNLASFPWDPKPDPPAPVSAPAAPVQQQQQPQPQPQQQQQSIPAPASHEIPVPNGSGMPPQRVAPPGVQSYAVPPNQAPVKPEPGVKVEPGLEATPNSFSNPAINARVIANLQSQYGSRADATINKLQETMGPAPNGAQYAPQSHPTGQPHPQYQNAQAQQQYRQQQQQQQQQQTGGGMQQRVPQPPQHIQKPAASQFDGAAEEGILVRQESNGQTTELGRVEIDRMLHAQLEARAKAMEGGGLMVPLQRAKKANPVSYHRTEDASGSGRFDGPDDDVKSEVDEDAINSDLDDSDDNVDDDDEDDDGGQIMLCMYDKVQRVKNKWKCVLKDGVLSVNGRDYVFHKASGEYEW